MKKPAAQASAKAAPKQKSKLTAKNLQASASTSMTLEEKIKKMKEDGEGACQLTAQDYLTLYNRFNQTGVKKLGAEVIKGWNDLKGEQGRTNKRERVHALLRAHVAWIGSAMLFYFFWLSCWFDYCEQY